MKVFSRPYLTIYYIIIKIINYFNSDSKLVLYTPYTYSIPIHYTPYTYSTHYTNYAHYTPYNYYPPITSIPIISSLTLPTLPTLYTLYPVHPIYLLYPSTYSLHPIPCTPNIPTLPPPPPRDVVVYNSLTIRTRQLVVIHAKHYNVEVIDLDTKLAVTSQIEPPLLAGETDFKVSRLYSTVSRYIPFSSLRSYVALCNPVL